MADAAVTFESECDFPENMSTDTNFDKFENGSSNGSSSSSSYGNISKESLSKKLGLPGMKNYGYEHCQINTTILNILTFFPLILYLDFSIFISIDRKA
jgi:hypothetical protein